MSDYPIKPADGWPQLDDMGAFIKTFFTKRKNINRNYILGEYCYLFMGFKGMDFNWRYQYQLHQELIEAGYKFKRKCYNISLTRITSLVSPYYEEYGWTHYYGDLHRLGSQLREVLKLE